MDQVERRIERAVEDLQDKVDHGRDGTHEQHGDLSLRVARDFDGDWVATVRSGHTLVGEDYFDYEEDALDWGRALIYSD